MNLCRIETGHKGNPLYIDPGSISLIGLHKRGVVEIYERGVLSVRFSGTGFTTTEIYTALEAHEAKQAGPTDREAMLIVRLRALGETWGGEIEADVAAILRDAGVPGAEPEPSEQGA